MILRCLERRQINLAIETAHSGSFVLEFFCMAEIKNVVHVSNDYFWVCMIVDIMLLIKNS